MQTHLAFLLVGIFSVCAHALSPACEALDGHRAVSVQSRAYMAHKDFAFASTATSVSPLTLNVPGEVSFDKTTRKLALRVSTWLKQVDCEEQAEECTQHLEGLRRDLKSLREEIQTFEWSQKLEINTAIVDCALERLSEFERAIAPR